jgi:hypothetical protein
MMQQRQRLGVGESPAASDLTDGLDWIGLDFRGRAQTRTFDRSIHITQAGPC